MYPGIDGNSWAHRSRGEFEGVVLTRKAMDAYWVRYTAGRDLSGDPLAAPLPAPSLADLPPAIVVLGGCDPLLSVAPDSLLPHPRYQRGKPRISAACALVATGRPACSQSATASSTRSTFLGVRSPP